MEWLRSKHFNVPSQNPDLNPTENLCTSADLKIFILQMCKAGRNKTKRLPLVVAVKDGSTKFWLEGGDCIFTACCPTYRLCHNKIFFAPSRHGGFNVEWIVKRQFPVDNTTKCEKVQGVWIEDIMILCAFISSCRESLLINPRATERNTSMENMISWQNTSYPLPPVFQISPYRSYLILEGWTHKMFLNSQVSTCICCSFQPH